MIEAGDTVKVKPNQSCIFMEGEGYVLHSENGVVVVLFGQLDSGLIYDYDESQLEKINEQG